MIRKKAAILGASAWLHDNNVNACNSKPGIPEWQSASLIEKPTLGMRQLSELASTLQCATLFPDSTYANIPVPDPSYSHSEPMMAFSHMPETNTSLQLNFKTVESQPRPQQDPLNMNLTARHEGFKLTEPMDSIFGASKNIPAPTPMSKLQETSTYIFPSEQTELRVWDAFHILKRRLIESTEPTTSDLLCLSYLEDRLRYLLRKTDSLCHPQDIPRKFPMRSELGQKATEISLQ